MIYIFTSAYNAEKTLQYSIDSILSQTYTDFEFLVLDNGSLDSTKNIIDANAARDARIKPLYNSANAHGVTIKTVLSLLNCACDSDYFCTLDADDVYSPGFLEKMLGFICKHQLEVASCGTDWVDNKTDRVLKHKVLDKDIVMEGQTFAEQFPIYRNYMVTVWGAVYSLKLLRQCSFEWARNTVFNDTAFAMEAYRKAKRAGVLAAVLHKYFVSSTSISYKFNADWFKACKFQDKISREYLLDYGPISRRNEDYLYVQLLILVKYILPRILYADASLSDKLRLLHETFTDDMTQYMLHHWEDVGIYSSRSEFLSEIKDWIHAQADLGQSQPVAEEILSALNV